MTAKPVLTLVIVVLSFLLVPGPVRAAESYDNCTGFIDSLPATISTQGVWCLRKNLSTAITSGAAISIDTHNVTIDCNDFKIGGLAAGDGTTAYGIHADDNRLNATVRHCNIRGFSYGVLFEDPHGGGHVVEDNRLDNNTYTGIHVEGDGSMVRRNRVSDTGGSTALTLTGSARGISSELNVDIRDNSVDGVLPNSDSNGDATSYGIFAINNTGGHISGNGVRGLASMGTGWAYGIFAHGSGTLLRDNGVSGPGSDYLNSLGIYCRANVELPRAKDNMISSFDNLMAGCINDGGNSM